MADPKGFLTDGRAVAPRRPVEERIKDWNEVYPGGIGRALLPIITKQAGRCMDCGIPFCARHRVRPPAFSASTKIR